MRNNVLIIEKRALSNRERGIKIRWLDYVSDAVIDKRGADSGSIAERDARGHGAPSLLAPTPVLADFDGCSTNRRLPCFCFVTADAANRFPTAAWDECRD